MGRQQDWGNWADARDAHAASKSVECNISGTYRDKWKAEEVMILEQSGPTFTARCQNGSWGPDEGKIEGSRLTIWNWLCGTFEDGTITWDNGGIWVRDPATQPVAVEQANPAAAGAAEPEDPWAEAAPAIDVSGTYSDPWQHGSLTVFKQSGTRLTASGPEGDWSEEGTVYGPDIEIFRQKARYEAGRVVWENGNVWEPTQAATQARAATPAAEASTPEASTPEARGLNGTWVDQWSGDSMVVTQSGSELSIVCKNGKWGPETGSVEGNAFQLWGMTAEFDGEIIRWSNGGKWTREPTPEAAGASNTGGVESGTPAADPWEAAGGGDEKHAAAWASWGGADAAAGAAVAAEQVADAQREARWRDISYWQSLYKKNNMLPGKTQEEIEADEALFFTQVEDDRAGIDFDLYDRVTCDISGPKSENIPMFSTFETLFEQFADHLPPALVENVKRCGYKRPTPVQKFSIPAGLIGRDVMCCAQTGSGKTAAFLVPILASMIKHGKATGLLDTPFEGACKPDTVVLSPTRELCLQIYGEAMKFCHKTPHRCVRVYGQEPVKTQLEQLAKGGDLCIATPGRLFDYVSTGIIDVTEVNCLVLDEADRMMSMNMEPFIRQVVEKFGMPQKEDRQTLMFSATFPEECQKLAHDYLYEHVFIGVGVVGGAVCTVTQTLLQVDPEDKMTRLIDFIYDWLSNRNESERLLVFTNRKDSAKGLDEKLYERNIDTGALHGDLTQTEREVNLQRFRSGEIDVLVATDLASRGLDISGVSHVVNYDLPWEVDIYVQRIGRTGRIGHRGEATTFISVGKDGVWHDKSDVLQALPGIMQDDDTGCQNEVPSWLLDHNAAELQSKWVQDEGGNWQERGKTDLRGSWHQDNTQPFSGGKWYQ